MNLGELTDRLQKLRDELGDDVFVGWGVELIHVAFAAKITIELPGGESLFHVMLGDENLKQTFKEGDERQSEAGDE